MKNYFITQKENGVINLTLKIMEPLVKLENKLLCRRGWGGLFLARLASLASLFLFLYITHFLIIYLGTVLVGFFIDSAQTSNDYWWTIPTILGLPIGTLLMINAINRNFIISEKIVNVLEIFNYSTKNTARWFGTRILVESFGLLLFVLFYSTAIFLSMSNFIDERTLFNWLEYKTTTLLLTTISFVVYMSIRVLLLEDNTPTQKFIKNRRMLCLWIAAGLITLGFIISDLFNIKENISSKFLYAGITLLISVDKIIDSYQKLRTVIDEIKK
ncbi:hypothetical protein [Lysinibacillus fusiformis]|uniref:hypothetical protein n=1 Tax=Lysinibacillus fusiformis TaxID=28031 RepID=UPI001EF5BF91|nr:hypothetical protein [Lysinibacillus fusiformis]MCG7436838.1 hypothetical protein [Lysinibacillus fusiformis]